VSRAEQGEIEIAISVMDVACGGEQLMQQGSALLIDARSDTNSAFRSLPA
jgi:hypothetical protein